MEQADRNAVDLSALRLVDQDLQPFDSLRLPQHCIPRDPFSWFLHGLTQSSKEQFLAYRMGVFSAMTALRTEGPLAITATNIS